MSESHPSTARPVVSVIIPMYQSGWIIEEAMDSLRSQTRTDFEAIIVNDGSTDDGPAAVRRLAAADPRFRVIDQENRGLSAARNAGIDAARGEYLHFLDADDRMMPWGLRRLVDLAASTGAPGVYARLDYRAVEMHPTGWSPMTDHPRVDHRSLLAGCVFPVHAQLIRRDAVGDTRFDPALRIGEDWDFWLRLGERGVWWAALDAVVGVYRMSPSSLSRDPDAMLHSLLRTVSAAHVRAGSATGTSDAVLAGLCLEWATARAAIGDTDATASALALLAMSPGGAPWSPREAAIKAFYRVAWIAGVTPCAWASAPPVMVSVATALWRAMEASNKVEPGFADRAIIELSDLSAHPGMVARECLDRAGAGRSVHLVGLGGNARYIAQECCRRGIPWTGSDDRGVDQWQPAWAGAVVGGPVRLAEPRPGGVVILTPTDDEILARRLATQSPIRWSQVRRDLASLQIAKFESALVPGNPTPGGVPVITGR